MNRIAVFAVIVLLCVQTSGTTNASPIETSIINQSITEPSPILSETYTTHSEIVIDGDYSLENYGFPGLGTLNDPFVIENLLIQGDMFYAIRIANTEKHLVIRNCYLNSSGIEIHLSSLSNVIIENCRIITENAGIILDQSTNCTVRENTIEPQDHPSGYDYYIRSSFFPRTTGIDISRSTKCNLSSNRIHWIEEGILIENSINCSFAGNNLRYNIVSFHNEKSLDNAIETNDVYYSDIGILLDNTNRTVVKDNWIIGNSQGIYVAGSQNRIYYNHIGWNHDSNALTDIYQGGWEFGPFDDNISMGNWWHDYDGSGYYQIPSFQEVYDRYPMKLEGDYLGPEIYFRYMDPFEADHSLYNETFTFEANVTDPSGVDVVQVWIFNGDAWLCKQMFHQPVDGNPNRYAYTINRTFPIKGRYYFWANDSLDNKVETMLFVYSLGTIVPLEKDPAAIIFIVSTTFVIPSCVGIAYYLVAKKKGEAHSRRTLSIYVFLLFVIMLGILLIYGWISRLTF